MPRCTALCIVMVAVPLGAASGQWLVGADVAALRFAAVADDTASGGRWTTLTASTAAVLRIERQFERVRIGIAVLHARSGFATEDRDLAVEAKDVFRLWEIAPELAVRIARTGPGATLWVQAGPVLDVWLPEGDETRARVGAQAGVALAFPVLARVAGTVRVLGSITPSPFDAVELLPDAAPRATRRIAVALGFRYRI